MKKYKIIISFFSSEDIEEIKEYYIHALNLQDAKLRLQTFMGHGITFVSCSHCYEGF